MPNPIIQNNRVNVFSAAKTMCEAAHWKITHLHIQKLMYLTQMLHLGINKEPFMETTFVLQHYGPVSPELQQKLSSCGGNAIQQDNFVNDEMLSRNNKHYNFIQAIHGKFGEYSTSALVATVHLPETAWGENFLSGGYGYSVTNEDMKNEYNAYYNSDSR